VSVANPMGYEESKNHLLCLSYQELQCLCKRYNIPAKKTHSQLASSLALLLEAPPSPAASPILLATAKETSKCDHVNNKRGPYNVRDDGRPLEQVKHQKGSQTPIDETAKGVRSCCNCNNCFQCTWTITDLIIRRLLSFPLLVVSRVGFQL